MTITAERIERCERDARRKARERGESVAVVTLDDGAFDREVISVSLGYCDSDEFVAFDGRILSIHHPDGAE